MYTRYPRRKREPQPIVLPERCGVFYAPRTTAIQRSLPMTVTLPGARSCDCGTVPDDPYARFCGQCGARL